MRRFLLVAGERTDVAKPFPDSEAVNQALRKVLSEQRVAEKRTRRRAG